MRGTMAQALHSFVPKETTDRRFLTRSTDDSLDSVPAIVGWTFTCVLDAGGFRGLCPHVLMRYRARVG